MKLQAEEAAFKAAEDAVRLRTQAGKEKTTPAVWAAVKLLTEFLKTHEADTRTNKVATAPDHILSAILELSDFLSLKDTIASESSTEQSQIRTEISNLMTEAFSTLGETEASTRFLDIQRITTEQPQFDFDSPVTNTERVVNGFKVSTAKTFRISPQETTFKSAPLRLQTVAPTPRTTPRPALRFEPEEPVQGTRSEPTFRPRSKPRPRQETTIRSRTVKTIDFKPPTTTESLTKTLELNFPLLAKFNREHELTRLEQERRRKLLKESARSRLVVRRPTSRPVTSRVTAEQTDFDFETLPV